MAKVSARTPVFARGSAVLDYWLTHPEGLTVRPLNARVERAVGPVPFGRAEALVVRRPNGRERFIPADAVVAVDPASEELFLEEPDAGDPVHEHVRRAAAATAGWTVPRTAAAARAFAAGVAWLAPRVAAISRRTAIATWRATHASAVWLAPRAAREARLIGRGCRRGAVAASAQARALRARRTSRRAVSGDSPRTSL